MKRFMVFFLVIGLLPLWINAENFDVRKLKWGMTVDEVKAIENVPNSYSLPGGHFVLYKNATLFENDIIIKFCFDQDKRLFAVNYESLKINADYDEDFLDAIREKMKKEEDGEGEGNKGKDSKKKESIKDETTLNYFRILKNKEYFYKYPKEARKYADNDYTFDFKGSNDYDLKKCLVKSKIWELGNTVILFNPIRGNSSLLSVQFVEKNKWEKVKKLAHDFIDVEIKQLAEQEVKPSEETAETLLTK